MLYYIIKRYL